MEPKPRKAVDTEGVTPERRRELIDKLREIVVQAQEGDEKALKRVREIFEEVPRLTRIFIDLAGEAERSLIKKVSGGDPLVREALTPQLKAMRGELAGPNPSPLERLLAERIVACWLQLQYADVLYAQNLGNLNMAQNEYHQKRLDRLHGRYLSAIKALAQIRKLSPAVQINIAEKQINTAG